MAEAKVRKIAKEKEKEERIAAKERRKVAQHVADANALAEAKNIVARHQQNREVCNRTLTCAQLVLLLRDMGLAKEAHARDGNKRLLQADLRALYWHNHVHIPGATGGSVSESNDEVGGDDEVSDGGADDEVGGEDEVGDGGDDATTGSGSESNDEEGDLLGDLFRSGSESNDEGGDLFRPDLGDTVEVYWVDEKAWYEGEVIDTNANMFQVHYVLDGEKHYHEFYDTKVRLKM